MISTNTTVTTVNLNAAEVKAVVDALFAVLEASLKFQPFLMFGAQALNAIADKMIDQILTKVNGS